MGTHHVYCLLFYIFKFFFKKLILKITMFKKSGFTLTFLYLCPYPLCSFEGISFLETGKTLNQASNSVALSLF